jgi:hypothetical protein
MLASDEALGNVPRSSTQLNPLNRSAKDRRQLGLPEFPMAST